MRKEFNKLSASIDIINEHGVNTKELTPEENKLREAMIKDDNPERFKLIFADKKEKDIIKAKRKKIKEIPKELASRPLMPSECWSPKEIDEQKQMIIDEANKKKIEIEPKIGKSIIEQIDDAPINFGNSEYGQCNSINNEEGNDSTSINRN